MIEVNKKQASEKGPEELMIKLTNGQLEALEKIKEDGNFNDIKSFLEFILAIFVGGNLTIYKKKGEENVKIEPADDLINK